jgi:hypothetical protein
MARRGRPATAERSESERLVVRLSRRQEDVGIKRAAENWARKSAGLPPLAAPKPAYSRVENVRLAFLCMRFLWLRQHAWLVERANLVTDIDRYLQDCRMAAGSRATLTDWDRLAGRMYDYIAKKQKVRIYHSGVSLKLGDMVRQYRCGEFGPDAPLMTFVLRI